MEDGATNGAYAEREDNGERVDSPEYALELYVRRVTSGAEREKRVSLSRIGDRLERDTVRPVRFFGEVVSADRENAQDGLTDNSIMTSFNSTYISVNWPKCWPYVRFSTGFTVQHKSVL